MIVDSCWAWPSIVAVYHPTEDFVPYITMWRHVSLHIHTFMKGWRFDSRSVMKSRTFMRSSLVKLPSPKLGQLCLWSLSEPAPSACSELSYFHFWWRQPAERHSKHKTLQTCKRKKKKKGLQVRICMWALTSSGCESTTFWQMLCSCAVSLTRPKSFSWVICRAVLPDDLHISWNTWGQGETRNTPVRTRM